MKKLLLSFITATLLSSMSAGSAGAQELPEQKETLATIVKVNDYFMKKYADYTLPSFFGRVRPSNIWTRGVYYEGLMALYSIYPREDYYSYTYDWANFHKWGMRNGNTTRNADDQCCGQVYIDLYNMCPSEHDPEYQSQHRYGSKHSASERLVVDRCYPDGNAHLCQIR